MRSPLHAALLFLSCALGGAQAAESPAVAPTASVAARTVSVATAAKLAAALPKVAVVKPEEKKPADEAADLRDTDKPANTIVRLPRYVVREPRPRVFRKQDLYHGDALGSQLARRYYSEGYLPFKKLMRFILPSAEASAMAQFREEEWLREKAEVEDHVNMVMRSDPASGAKFQSSARDTFLHWSELRRSNPALK